MLPSLMWRVSRKPSAANFKWQEWQHTQGPPTPSGACSSTPRTKNPLRTDVGLFTNWHVSSVTLYTSEKLNRHLKRDSMNTRESHQSPVGHHLGEHKHRLHIEIKILDKDSRWFEIDMREAIQIRTRSPSLNRDQGWHQLLPLYNSLLSCDVGHSTSE